MTTVLDASNPLGSYWVAAASTGFAGPTHWKTWADKLIERLEQSPLWIINMSLASTPDELYRALETRRLQEEHAQGGIIPLGNAKLGFYYLRYERGDYTLSQLLCVAGDEADGGTADLPCEAVFGILNAVEQAGHDSTLLAVLASRTKDLFSSYRRTAQLQWAAIQSAIEG